MGNQVKQFRRKMGDIEAGAYHVAAEVLLIGLNHIKEHRASYPIGMTHERWYEIVDELIWFCQCIVDDDYRYNAENQERFEAAHRLLGEHFTNIWC